MRQLATLTFLVAAACAHVVMVYPGWRGNNLVLNGSVEETNGLGAGLSEAATLYPYGMQWIYPCGGMPLTSNRTNWLVAGGAVSFQPGWFTGHRDALLYVNMGFGSVPQNYSVPLVAGFQIQGPSDSAYPGTVCLPQVPIPAGYDVRVGDEATIQVVEIAKHGAAMYSCVDITYADAADVTEVNETNCFNSTDISIGGRAITSSASFAASPTVSATGSDDDDASIATATSTSGMAGVRSDRLLGAVVVIGLAGVLA
ncbi:hypothetical protein F5Y15DRAFT_410992 [Xylariaceae sp. FL0016]|nr:hypothetical protein F5Y15DRAFT_410992 [Xylariaceae sp. FL0016]